MSKSHHAQSIRKNIDKDESSLHNLFWQVHPFGLTP